MRWAGFWAGVLGTVSFGTVAAADPIVHGSAVSSDLPIAAAAFPSEGATAAPAVVAPEGAPASAPATVSPAPPDVDEAPSPEMVQPDAEPSEGGPSYCVEPSTPLEIGAVAIARFIEGTAGWQVLSHAFGVSSDEQAFDDAAAMELRRLRFMRHLVRIHGEQDAREFSAKLEQSLRKREFLRGLEEHQQLAPSPFERGTRH